jgi:hypothetical protein
MKTTLKATAPSRQFGRADNGLKFDAKKCLRYIDSMEDFTIEFERKPAYDEESATFIYPKLCIRTLENFMLTNCQIP